MRTLPLTELMQHNLADVLCFAYSKKLIDSEFLEYGVQRTILYDISRKKAETSLINFALYLRYLDDMDNYGEHLSKSLLGPQISFGNFYTKETSQAIPMSLRDVCNKIIHAGDYEWSYTDGVPLLICISYETSKWLRAEILLSELFRICYLIK
jgi:hypothetical protein